MDLSRLGLRQEDYIITLTAGKRPNVAQGGIFVA